MEFSERLQIALFTLRDPELNAVYSGNADVRHVPRELAVPYTSLSSPLISSVLRHYGVLLQCRRIGLLQDLGSEVVCWFVAHVHVHLLPLHRN